MRKPWTMLLALGVAALALLPAGGCKKRPATVQQQPPTQVEAPQLPAPAPVPVGRERRDKDWDADVAALLFARRVTASDLVGGLGGIAFDPAACRRCHENAQGVEGQVFYGPQFKDFAKDQWPEMLSRPETGQVPIKDYDFVKEHEKRVELVYGVFPEQQVKQNP